MGQQQVRPKKPPFVRQPDPDLESDAVKAGIAAGNLRKLGKANGRQVYRILHPHGEALRGELAARGAMVVGGGQQPGTHGQANFPPGPLVPEGGGGYIGPRNFRAQYPPPPGAPPIPRPQPVNLPQPQRPGRPSRPSYYPPGPMSSRMDPAFGQPDAPPATKRAIERAKAIAFWREQFPDTSQKDLERWADYSYPLDDYAGAADRTVPVYPPAAPRQVGPGRAPAFGDPVGRDAARDRMDPVERYYRDNPPNVFQPPPGMPPMPPAEEPDMGPMGEEEEPTYQTDYSAPRPAGKALGLYGDIMGQYGRHLAEGPPGMEPMDPRERRRIDEEGLRAERQMRWFGQNFDAIDPRLEARLRGQYGPAIRDRQDMMAGGPQQRARAKYERRGKGLEALLTRTKEMGGLERAAGMGRGDPRIPDWARSPEEREAILDWERRMGEAGRKPAGEVGGLEDLEDRIARGEATEAETDRYLTMKGRGKGDAAATKDKARREANVLFGDIVRGVGPDGKTPMSPEERDRLISEYDAREGVGAFEDRVAKHEGRERERAAATRAAEDQEFQRGERAQKGAEKEREFAMEGAGLKQFTDGLIARFVNKEITTDEELEAALPDLAADLAENYPDALYEEGGQTDPAAYIRDLWRMARPAPEAEQPKSWFPSSWFGMGKGASSMEEQWEEENERRRRKGLPPIPEEGVLGWMRRYETNKRKAGASTWER